MKPPIVRPMTPQTRQRIRRHILREATIGRRSRGWLPVLAAGTCVAAVLASMVAVGIVTGAESGLDSGPPTTQATTGPAEESVVVDRGAPSPAQLAAAKSWCLRNQQATGATIEFARRVLWAPARLPVRTVTAVLIRTSDGKHRACFHDVSYHLVREPLPTPTPANPVRRFADNGGGRFFRVHPSVARLETRVRLPALGLTSPWSRAFISNGIAYAADVGNQIPSNTKGAVFDIRAYDAAGRPIPM